MLKVLVVDDESLARQTVMLLLDNIVDITQIYEANNGNQALDLAREHQPDIVILDIEIPGKSGLEVSKHLPEKSVVIFATAFNHYITEASGLNSADYILKPFNDERFYAAIDRAKQKLRVLNSPS